MILISHRGNIDGKIPERENHPSYIDEALSKKYEVEIDIWVKNTDKIYLGHDGPEYEVSIEWLKERSDNLWIHCKNLDALYYFNSTSYKFNYFWHQEDTVTLTSLNFIWAYPGKQPIRNSIAVLPEIFNDNVNNCIGICSDFIKNYHGK